MDDAVAAAVKLLAARARSRAKLSTALTAKGFELAQVDAALVRVTQLGYLDDKRYADAKARAGFAEGRSLGDVKRRLSDDGVDPGVADEVARELGYDALGLAKALVKKRKLTGAKAARFLAGRQFDEDVIERVVGNGLE